MQMQQIPFLVNLKSCQGQWNDKLTLQKWYELTIEIRLQQQGSNPSQASIDQCLNMFDQTITAATHLYDDQTDARPHANQLFNEICEFYQWLGNQTGFDNHTRLECWNQWRPSNDGYPLNTPE